MVHKKESGGLFRLYKRSALLGHPLPTTMYIPTIPCTRTSCISAIFWRGK